MTFRLCHINNPASRFHGRPGLITGPANHPYTYTVLVIAEHPSLDGEYAFKADEVTITEAVAS